MTYILAMNSNGQTRENGWTQFDVTVAVLCISAAGTNNHVVTYPLRPVISLNALIL